MHFLLYFLCFYSGCNDTFLKTDSKMATRNISKDNEDDGIYLSGSNSAVVKDNTIEDNNG